MSHFVMERDGSLPRVRILEAPSWPKGDWNRGLRIDNPPPGSLEYELDPRCPGSLEPLFEDDVPIMSLDVAGVLHEVGVDNIEYFEAIIHEPRSGRTLRDYTAFNVVGLVSGADLKASEFMVEPSPDAPMDVDFEKLVLDQSRIPPDLLVFRLAASGRPIVVHAKVRQAIEAAGIGGVRFFEAGEWSG